MCGCVDPHLFLTIHTLTLLFHNPNIITVWKTTVNEAFDCLWTNAIQAKGEYDAEKKAKQGNKHKWQKGTEVEDVQVDGIASTGGNHHHDTEQNAGSCAPNTLISVTVNDADKDEEGKDWHTCTVSVEQVLHQELCSEDDNCQILGLLDEGQVYATKLKAIVYPMVHKETIMVS